MKLKDLRKEYEHYGIKATSVESFLEKLKIAQDAVVQVDIEDSIDEVESEDVVDKEDKVRPEFISVKEAVEIIKSAAGSKGKLLVFVQNKIEKPIIYKVIEEQLRKKAGIEEVMYRSHSGSYEIHYDGATFIKFTCKSRYLLDSRSKRYDVELKLV